MKYLILVVIALIFLKAGWDRLEPWIAKKTGDESHLTFKLFDWNTTAPGKLLGEVVRPELVNWIMWPAVVLLILLVLWVIYTTFTKRDPGVGNPWWILPFLVAVVIGAAAYDLHFNSSAQGKKVLVDQRGLQPRVVEININDPMHLFSARYSGKQKGMVYIGCGTVTWPQFLIGNRAAPKIQIAALEMVTGYDTVFILTQKYKEYLVSQGISRVRVEWTVALVPQDQPNCQHTWWGPDPT